MEDEPARHAVALRGLEEVPVGNDGAALDRSKDQKPADEPLGMTHGHRIRAQVCSELTGDQEKCESEAPFHDGRFYAARARLRAGLKENVN